MAKYPLPAGVTPMNLDHHRSEVGCVSTAAALHDCPSVEYHAASRKRPRSGPTTPTTKAPMSVATTSVASHPGASDSVHATPSGDVQIASEATMTNPRPVLEILMEGIGFEGAMTIG